MKTTGFPVCLIIGALAAVFSALITSSCIIETATYTAIENNCARYNPETGVFEWIARSQGEAK